MFFTTQKRNWSEKMQYDRFLKEPIEFQMHAALTYVAEKPSGMDKFAITLTNEYGRTIQTEYSTGTGHRKYPKGAKVYGKLSIYDWENSRVTAPKIKDVFYSLALDYLTARELPHATPEALDYLASEFGYTQPSECAKVLEALRHGADQWRAFCSGTGIDCEDMAEYFSEQG